MPGVDAAIPVPVRLTICGEPLALLAMSICAVAAPSAAGVNITVTKQVAPGARLVAQSGLMLAGLIRVNAPLPVLVMPLISKVANPLLVTAMLCKADELLRG